MSSLATSSPVSASTFRYLMRWPVFLLIWLKLTLSASDVAGYSATGQVTSESRKKPFQFARGAMDADTPDRQGWRQPIQVHVCVVPTYRPPYLHLNLTVLIDLPEINGLRLDYLRTEKEHQGYDDSE